MTTVLHIAAIWVPASVIVALWIGRAIRHADRRDQQRIERERPCCGSGHPEAGDDDLAGLVTA